LNATRGGFFTFAGFNFLAGFSAIHPDSEQNRKNERNSSSLLFADIPE
jgi:hypothetical protein